MVKPPRITTERNIDDVTAAVLGGDPDVPALRCLALAEVANQAQVETVHNHVRNTVFQRMREVCDAYAADAYTQIAEKFDKAAKLFTAAATVADPEADATQMVEAADKIRRGWLDSESFGNQLTRLLPAMAASAALAGIDNTESDAALMPLVADLAGVHRRRAWESWVHQGGRTNRWGQLLKVGAVLLACPLAEYPGAYREPKPIEHRREEFARGQYRVVDHDPEDENFVPEPINPRRRQGRVTAI